MICCLKLDVVIILSLYQCPVHYQFILYFIIKSIRSPDSLYNNR